MDESRELGNVPVPLTFSNLPGIWQLREGPRGVGLWILLVVIGSAALLVFRHDRVLCTFSGDTTAGLIVSLLSCVSFPFLAIWLGWKRPERPKYGKSQWQLVRERFVRSPQAQIGFFFVATLYYMMFVSAYLAPFGGTEIVDAVNLKRMPPLTPNHVFGTDDFGRDILSRIIHGSTISLVIGLLTVMLSASLGLVLGLLAGYFGGKIDWVIMRAVDVLLSLPRLVFLIVLMVLFKNVEMFEGEYRIFLIVIFLGLMGWMGTARLVRGEVLQKRQQDFVQAGRALGFGDMRILFRHIAPNCLAPVIVSATLGIGGTILVDASLSFLGLGVPPPFPTWGADVAAGRQYLLTEWWLSLIPGVAIILAVTSFNLLGDGLRDALDPRLASTGKVPSDEKIQELIATPAGFAGVAAPGGVGSEGDREERR